MDIDLCSGSSLVKMHIYTHYTTASVRVDVDSYLDDSISAL